MYTLLSERAKSASDQPSKDPWSYIDKLIYSIKTVLSPSMCSLLLADKYYDELIFNGLIPTEEMEILGPVLYLEEESLSDYNRLKNLMREYLYKRINSFFGISFEEYINMSISAKMAILEVADEHAEYLTRTGLQAEKEISNLNPM